jgi:uncharacterized protein
MPAAWFHFYPDLNHFLTSDRRGGHFLYSFEDRQSAKHLIESAGVPHTEIGRLNANDQAVNFSYLVQDGDQMVVFPACAETDQVVSEHRFVLDNHLGRLAAFLRMLGFDSLYRNNFDDEELAQISMQEDRILLTRDRRLLMRSIVRWGYCLRSLDSRQQVFEVTRRYRLQDKIRPFRRCLRCNSILDIVSKEAVDSQLEPLTRLYYEDFRRCPTCQQIYWKGSHFEDMLALINAVRNTS